MVPRENKNNAYAKFGGTNKEYYGIFRTGLLRTRDKPCIIKRSVLGYIYTFHMKPQFLRCFGC